MAQGFTVSADSLAAGSQDVTSLLPTCEKVSSDAVAALSGMADAADGHPTLAGALIAAAERGANTFVDIGGAYAYTGENLKATAAIYTNAEQDNARKIAAIRNRAG